MHQLSPSEFLNGPAMVMLVMTQFGAAPAGIQDALAIGPGPHRVTLDAPLFETSAIDHLVGPGLSRDALKRWLSQAARTRLQACLRPNLFEVSFIVVVRDGRTTFAADRDHKPDEGRTARWSDVDCITKKLATPGLAPMDAGLSMTRIRLSIDSAQRWLVGDAVAWRAHNASIPRGALATQNSSKTRTTSYYQSISRDIRHIRANGHLFSKCYSQAPARFAGRLVVAFTLDERGVVTKPHIRSRRGGGDVRAERCVVRVMRNWVAFDPSVPSGTLAFPLRIARDAAR